LLVLSFEHEPINGSFFESNVPFPTNKHPGGFGGAEEFMERYGTRYAVDGFLTAPDGTRLNIRSAWFIDHGTQEPRFVTAHPPPKS
jgi:hypothetical protein